MRNPPRRPSPNRSRSRNPNLLPSRSPSPSRKNPAGRGRSFKIYRPKQQAAAPGEDFDEAGEYGEDYGGGEYDDLPPWDEEEEKEDGE